jgi:ribonuclease E
MPGGKGIGKQLRYVPPQDDEDDDNDDDNEDDDDDDEEDDDDDDDDDVANEGAEEPIKQPVIPVQRSGGKQFGGKQLPAAGGKYLRPS